MGASSVHIDEVNMEDTQDPGPSICRIKPRRVKVAAKVNQRKLSKSVSCSCHLEYYRRASLSLASSDQEELNPSIPSWYAIFIFLDPLLLGVLQVEYQNKQESPFDTHPIQMQTFLMAICIYSAVLGIRLLTQARSGYYQERILSFVLLVSGSLSSASLLSIMLHRILLWLVLIIWGSIPIVMGRHLLKNSVYWILGLVVELNLKSKFSSMVSIFHRKAQSSNINLTDRFEGV